MVAAESWKKNNLCSLELVAHAAFSVRAWRKNLWTQRTYARESQEICEYSNVVFHSELSRWSFFWVQLRPFTPMHLVTRFKEFSANCWGEVSISTGRQGPSRPGEAFHETPDVIHRQAETPSSPWVAWKSANRSCPACPNITRKKNIQKSQIFGCVDDVDGQLWKCWMLLNLTIRNASSKFKGDK